MTQNFYILGIKTDVLKCLKDGVTAAAIEKNTHAYGRAKQIVSSSSHTVWDLYGPSSPGFDAVVVEKAQKFDNNLI